MERKKSKFRYLISTVIRRSTLICILAVFCVFLAVYAFIYQRSAAQLREMALQDSMQSFTALADDLNTFLEKELTLLTDMEFVNQIRQYLTEDGVYQNKNQIYARQRQVNKILKNKFGTDPLITNVMILYFHPEGDCLCAGSFGTGNLKQDYQGGILRLDDLDYIEFRQLIMTASGSRYIRSPLKTGQFSYHYNSGFSGQSGFIVSRYSDMNAAAPLYAVLQISMDQLQSNMTSLHYASPAFFRFSAEGPSPGSDMTLLTEVQGNASAYTDSEDRLYVSRYIPALSGYCTIMLDKEIIYAGIENFRVLFRLLLYAAIILLIIVMITFFRHWRYPVLQLANQLPGDGSLPPIKLINYHLTELKQQNNTYQEKLSLLEPAVQAEALRSFFRGEDSSAAESPESALNIGITDSSVFRCICVGTLNTVQSDDALFNLVNPVVMEKSSRIAVAFCMDHVYTAIIPVDPDEAEQFRLNLEEILASLNNLQQDCLYAIGMSDSYIGKDSLRIAYREALLGWTDARTWQNSGIVNCDTVEGLSSDYNVDYKQLDTLYNFLLHGDTASALNTFDYLVKQNFQTQNSKKLRQLFFQQFYFDIVGVLARLSSRYNLAETLDTLLSQGQNLSVADTLNRLRHALGECSGLIPKKDARDDLSAAICKFCEKHFQDPDLSLSSISDEFGFTESNMSKFFKAHTGVSYSIYIENLRISKAEYLLSSTSDSVKEIAAAVGYQNVTTFYNAFRRKYGCTPSQWAENHRTSPRPADEPNSL